MEATHSGGTHFFLAFLMLGFSPPSPLAAHPQRPGSRHEAPPGPGDRPGPAQAARGPPRVRAGGLRPVPGRVAGGEGGAAPPTLLCRGGFSTVLRTWVGHTWLVRTDQADLPTRTQNLAEDVGRGQRIAKDM